MRIFAPNYYKSFSCIADKCVHNCCIGWEIDIDEESLNFYNTINGSFGEKLRKNICTKDETPHFNLSENERCPFLDEKNLCEIFTELGEEHLCQICTDHPRFRNFFDSRIEIGLGLTCEEATRLILSQKEKVSLIEIQADENLDYSEDDDIFFEFRESIFNIVQNRTISVKERIENLLSRFDITLPKKTPAELADIFLGFEQMDSAWTARLLNLKSIKNQSSSVILTESFDLAAEQLLVYFIYRHLSDAVFDGKFKERIAFACFSVIMIDIFSYSHFIEQKTFNISDLIEISRLYSSEIEYSEESISFFLDDFFNQSASL